MDITRSGNDIPSIPTYNKIGSMEKSISPDKSAGKEKPRIQLMAGGKSYNIAVASLNIEPASPKLGLTDFNWADLTVQDKEGNKGHVKVNRTSLAENLGIPKEKVDEAAQDKSGAALAELVSSKLAKEIQINELIQAGDELVKAGDKLNKELAGYRDWIEKDVGPKQDYLLENGFSIQQNGFSLSRESDKAENDYELSKANNLLKSINKDYDKTLEKARALYVAAGNTYKEVIDNNKDAKPLRDMLHPKMSDCTKKVMQLDLDSKKEWMTWNY